MTSQCIDLTSWDTLYIKYNAYRTNIYSNVNLLGRGLVFVCHYIPVPRNFESLVIFEILTAVDM
jgi:hypothetical protein